VPNHDLSVALGLPGTQGTNAYWTVSLTNPLVAASTILLSATNDVGFWTNRTVYVVRTPYLPADGGSLDDSGLDWVTWGNAAWFGQTNITHSGQSAVQSGVIGNFQESLLQTTVTGPGRLTFWWKVSSEFNYDFLEFNLAGQAYHISGELDWQRQVFPVPQGSQTLIWRYYKDQNTSIGADAGWVDGVTFEPGIWLELIGGPTNGQTALLLHGVPGRTYSVMVSTNSPASGPPAIWAPLQPSVLATNLSMPFQDTNSNSRLRFYKLHDSAAWLETPNRLANGSLQLLAGNSAGMAGALQVSTDLMDWTTLASLPNAPAILSYTDTPASAVLNRRYRAVLFP
jgi:hypothetical protein